MRESLNAVGGAMVFPQVGKYAPLPTMALHQCFWHEIVPDDEPRLIRDNLKGLQNGRLTRVSS